MPSVALSPNPGVDVTTDERTPRTLILCFDGTSNQYDGDNTNVVKFYSLLRKDDDFDQQLCYYQPGIGTYFNPGVVSPLFQWGAKILDEAFAWYLDEHVRGGYQFLMQNYVAGDKICIFGFSRGAYTARALAGMLHKIGLLPRDNPEQVPFAYKLYKQTDAESLALAAGFKQTFCRDVKIEFVGVWETVASVGVIMGRSLPFTTSNTTIKTFRHALSLDEHRVRFLPNLYHRPVPGEADTPAKAQAAFEKAAEDATAAKAKGKTAVKRPTAGSKRQRSLGEFLRMWPSKQRKDAATMPLPKVKQDAADAGTNASASGSSTSGSTSTSTSSGSSGSSSGIHAQDDEIPGGTDVLEVWFAGCHSDVGGGSVPNDTELSLSNITLRWMVREVIRAQCPIEFDQAVLLRAHIPVSTYEGTGMVLPPNASIVPAGQAAVAVAASPSGSGSGNDPLEVDPNALQPIHDQFDKYPTWWMLEVVPLSCTYQDTDGEWKKKWWVHLGRGRQIYDAKPKFHVTVKQRMEDPDLKYKPRAQYTPGTETYVQ
ncbi:hypothetical protein C8Q76DRAFT_733337 [Earliella scabrosa]|nr:hypothetical protein C8Q76DRAFT_733337 [Earliella scabrosa]